MTKKGGIRVFSNEQLEEYKKKYDLVSVEELQKCAAVAEVETDGQYERFFESLIEIIQGDRKRELKHGVRSVRTQPLVLVLSATVTSEDESLALYGSIRAEYDGWKHDLFKCKSDAPQFIGTSGVLPLEDPDFLCRVSHGCILLESNIVVQLFDQTGKEYADQEFMVDDESDKAYEVVVSKSIPCERGTLTLRYIVIPHGVGSRIHINVYRRRFPERDSFDVSGRIVFKYANTYGHSSSGSEECVLFDKQGEESERVLEENCGKLRLLRCWVALSAYSVLHVDVDLKISRSDQNVENVVGTVKLNTEPGWGSEDTVVGDDYLVNVNAAWFSPQSCPLPYVEWIQPFPHPHPALEIFSVWIYREKWTELSSRVYGSIEANLGGHPLVIFNCDRENALPSSSDGMICASPSSSDGMICIPVSYGCRKFGGRCEYLDFKLDIKDVENSLVIRGTVEWDAIILQRYHDNMHCSVFRGQNGYAAVHYAVFPNALEASIRVYFHPTSRDDIYMRFNEKIGDRGSELAAIFLEHITPEHVWFEGVVEAKYGDYIYSSKYDNKYDPIFLFHSTGIPPADYTGYKIPPPNFMGYEIPLSRSRIVVPIYSELHLTINLLLQSNGLLSYQRDYGGPWSALLRCDQVAKIEMGEKGKTLEGACGDFRIEVDWREIEGRR